LATCTIDFGENIPESHDAYDSHSALADNLSTLYAKNRYKINEQDFFYAGTRNLIYASAIKSSQDAYPDEEPTETMCETIEEINDHLSTTISTENRVAAGYARLAFTVRQYIVDP